MTARSRNRHNVANIPEIKFIVSMIYEKRTDIHTLAATPLEATRGKRVVDSPLLITDL